MLVQRRGLRAAARIGAGALASRLGGWRLGSGTDLPGRKSPGPVSTLGEAQPAGRPADRPGRLSRAGPPGEEPAAATACSTSSATSLSPGTLLGAGRRSARAPRLVAGGPVAADKLRAWSEPARLKRRRRGSGGTPAPAPPPIRGPCRRASGGPGPSPRRRRRPPGRRPRPGAGRLSRRSRLWLDEPVGRPRPCERAGEALGLSEAVLSVEAYESGALHLCVALE